ncbi:MAG: universal stress protein [Desulfovibrio sp.]|uniref:universal stress protein n=1 Tax=Desulfovibrio sp. 7SRBS1 TaxID=3378064 RepID=UPI003B3F0405
MKTFFQRFTRGNSPTTNTALAEDVCKTQRAERPQCKILVVCKGNEFSSGVINYAIDMACKTRSALVALNLDEKGTSYDEFQVTARTNIQRFETKANAAGLHFAHEVRQGAEAKVIDEMYQADATFRYVMDDAAAVCKNKKVIPVYTRATLRAK